MEFGGRYRVSEDQAHRVGFTAFDATSGRAFVGAAELPRSIRDLWLPRHSQIMMVELFAPVLAALALPQVLRNRRVILLVDSEAAEGAIVKGSSSKEDINALAARFWEVAMDLRADIYVDRVPTDGNLADGPSRGCCGPLVDAGAQMVRPPVYARPLQTGGRSAPPLPPGAPPLASLTPARLIGLVGIFKAFA